MISQLSSVVSLPQPPHAPLDFPSSFLTCAALLILSVQSTDSAVHRQVLRLGIPEMSENIILKNYTTPASAFYKLSVYSSPLLPLVCSSTFIVLPQIQLVKLHHFITHLNQVTELKPFLLSCFTRHIILNIMSSPQCHVFSQCWPLIIFFLFLLSVICQFYYILLIPLNCLKLI